MDRGPTSVTKKGREAVRAISLALSQTLHPGEKPVDQGDRLKIRCDGRTSASAGRLHRSRKREPDSPLIERET